MTCENSERCDQEKVPNQDPFLLNHLSRSQYSTEETLKRHEVQLVSVENRLHNAENRIAEIYKTALETQSDVRIINKTLDGMSGLLKDMKCEQTRSLEFLNRHAVEETEAFVSQTKNMERLHRSILLMAMLLALVLTGMSIISPDLFNFLKVAVGG